jgi:hypothetical protein
LDLKVTPSLSLVDFDVNNPVPGDACCPLPPFLPLFASLQPIGANTK